MSFQPLRERIIDLPLILCGPILRRVEPDSVSVFVALKHRRSIKLSVYEGLTADPARIVAQSNESVTVRLGKFLHVSVVTARPTGIGSLNPSQLYGYDLSFTQTDDRDPEDPLITVPTILADHGLLKGEYRLGYGQDNWLPSFALPPTDLNKLRIIHGSCRKLHGEGLDALEALDRMLESNSTFVGADNRPHQLFLTGDQIYADDVADILLYLLSDAGDTLLGWSEKLDWVKDQNDLIPGFRVRVAKEVAGLTGMIKDQPEYAKSHLLKLNEYLSMYLFAWSDVLWPKELPINEYEAEYPPLAPRTVSEIHWSRMFYKENKNIERFIKTLPRVMRALANIPVYMIFDDHEITDDWNLNLKWCERVYSKPLGKYVVQNGLIAFAIFQAWGNTPKRFEKGKDGYRLFEAIENWSLSQGNNAFEREVMNHLVGVPDKLILPRIKANKGLSHMPRTIDWHYTVSGSNYKVIVMDPRTWRGYPGASIDFPSLLTKEAFQKQILDISDTGEEVTIIISPAPIIGVPFIEKKQSQAETESEKFAKDTEAWALEESSFETLLATFARRSKQVSDKGVKRREGRFLILSGDVHYGFTARIQYWADRPFQDPQKIESNFVAVQLTSSALRNETSQENHGITKATHTLHEWGFISGFNSLPEPRTFGWENQNSSSPLVLGEYSVFGHGGIPPSLEWSKTGNPVLHKVDLQYDPITNPAPNLGGTRIYAASRQPDWRYRVDYILAENEVRKLAPFEPFINLNYPVSTDRQGALKNYLTAAKNHKDYLTKWGNGKEIVGVNNLGEITLIWNSNDKSVIHKLWWRLKGDTDYLEPFPLTKYIASLDFNPINSSGRPRYPKPITPR